MPDWLGKTIGSVQIEKLLARGGMGQVYSGTHLTFGRPVAIKVLQTYIEEKPTALEQFHRVAEQVMGLHHPHIVQVLDFNIAEGHPYIVMEYVRGPALAAYLQTLQQRKKRLPPEQAVGLLKGLTAALDYAHGQGVIHRAIKPSNILLRKETDAIPLDRPLTEDVEALLTDFGIAEVVHSASQTASGLINGTAVYMAPEQARGDPVDHRTDLYSLGVVLYEMLAGRVPFEADNTVTVLHMQIHTPPPPIAGIPDQVQAVIARLLAKNPGDRYQTAQEMANDFYRAIGIPAQTELVRESHPVQAVPGEVPPPPKPEPMSVPPPRTQPEAPAKSQPKIEKESNPATQLRVEPQRTAKPARSWIWIGAGLLALVCLAVVAFGALRYLPSLPKPQPQPADTLTPVPPTAAASSVSPSPAASLPSAQGMVQIPAGTYEVGTTLYTDDYHTAPQKVALAGFWIDQYQTTNAQYQQFMTATNAPAPAVWPGAGDHPVRGVTWDQAMAYCTWANKRLPKEAEWEVAGRGAGPTPQMYPWGNDDTAGGQAFNLPEDDTYAVGSRPFNKSPFGVFDLVGNVWEWVGEPYATTQQGYRYLHGGRFGLPIIDLAYRLGVASGDTRYVQYTGFRCASDQVKQ